TTTINGLPQQNGTITISGTPTQSGVFSIFVSLEDGTGETTSGDYTLTIDEPPVAPISVGGLTPNEWTVNAPGFSGTIPVSGGASGYGNLIISGLPAGLSYSIVSNAGSAGQQSGTITVSGTPTESGLFTLNVSLQDGKGN